jgi:hypothetical protein
VGSTPGGSWNSYSINFTVLSIEYIWKRYILYIGLQARIKIVMIPGSVAALGQFHSNTEVEGMGILVHRSSSVLTCQNRKNMKSILDFQKLLFGFLKTVGVILFTNLVRFKPPRNILNGPGTIREVRNPSSKSIPCTTVGGMHAVQS